MKTLCKMDLVKAAGSALAVLALVTPGLAGAQQANGSQMEETNVTGVASPIVAGTPKVYRSGTQTQSRTVRYGDLNLEREDGINTLYLRLKTAVSQVCSPRESYHDRALSRDWESCYNTAMDEAVEAVGNLGLQQYHLARTDSAQPPTALVADR